MTRLRTRLRAPRLPLLLLVGWSCVSAMGAGCSSGVKTVTVDCPTGGASGSAGQAAMTNGGSAPSGGSAGAADEAGEAGASGTESGGAQGGMSVGGGGSAGANGGASGGHAGAGTGGHGGGTSGGANTSGGHGGVGGSSASGGSSGAKALCGDKAVTPPEFCDDGTNTDLSYGCYACTTLPSATAPQGAQQCDACLQQTPTKACFACQDHRACYACLRRQPSSFSDTFCSNDDDDDVMGDPLIHRQLSDDCFDPKDPLGSGQIGGPAGSATRGSVCQALLACALRTGCATGRAADGTPRTPDGVSGCYCGDGRDCNAQPAAGPCVQEVRAAAAVPPMLSPSQEFAYVGIAFTDSLPTDAWSMLGVVGNLLQCANDGCASACYTAGFGGSAGSGGSAGHGGGP